jgi:predicted lipoprotein with Yx(FWY)xxD motif
MLRIPSTLRALLGAATLALLGQAQAAEPATVQDGMLVDANGMTLYTNDKDAMGKSSCNDACAGNWPPLAAAANADESDDWSVIQRDDGSWQWAYYGKPLYTFIQDQQPGDRLGDGKLGVWHVARPEAGDMDEE